MRSLKKIGCLSAILVALSGCSIFEDDEEEPLFGELPEIEQPFTPNEVWSESLSGGGSQEFYSRLSPTVTENSIVVANRLGIITAFNKENGDELWSLDLRDKSKMEFMDSFAFWDWVDESSALLSGGILSAFDKLYIGSEHGVVHCIDPETGSLLWSADVKGEVVTSPSAGDGLIVVNTASGVMTALHPDSGEVRWSHEQDLPPLTLRGGSSPTIEGGAVIFGGASGRLSLVTSNSGLEMWNVNVGNPTGATDLARLVDVDTKPIISGNLVYAVGYQGHLVAVEIRTGRTVWKREYSAYRDVVLSGAELYVTDAQGYLHALDARNGIERWSMPDLFNRGLTEVLATEKYLILGDSFGYIHFVDKESGELTAFYEVSSDGIEVAPVKVNDKFAVLTKSGSLVLFEGP